MRTLARFAALILSCPAIAIAQNQTCNGVLSLAGHDLSNTEIQVAYADSAYNQLCSGDQLKAGVNENSASSVMSSIVSKSLTGGFGASLDRARHMCQQYSSWREGASSTKEYTSTVVRDAIKAWDDCQAMANDGAIINVKSSNETLSISVRGGRFDGNYIGVSVNPKNAAKCILYDARNGHIKQKDATSTDGLPIKLNSKTELNVVCNRTPMAVAGSNAGYFEQTDITVLTDNGQLLLPLARDARYTPTYASEVAAQLAAMKELVAKNQDALSRLGAATTKDEQDVSNWLNAGKYERNTRCPDGYYVAGIHTLTSYGPLRGDTSGWNQRVSSLSYSCRPFLAPATPTAVSAEAPASQ